VQHISNSEGKEPVSMIEAMAMKEPVAFNGPQGTELVAMTLKDYNRITLAKVTDFKDSWRCLSEEAERNGLTQQKLDNILKSAH